MIAITGFINNVIEEDKLVSAQDVVKMFDLPFQIGDKVRFRVLPKHIKKDRRGQKRLATRRLLPTLIEGVYKNNQYSIRYYATKVNRPATQHTGAFTTYLPRNIELSGEVTDFDTVVDSEIAVMLMLHYKCKNGPFFNNQVDAEYEYVDTEAEAKKALEKELYTQEALDFFKKSKDTEKIMRVAKGFIVPGTGAGVNRSLLDSDVETRMAMIDMAKKFPNQVAAALVDPVVLTRGAIHVAIDDGLIKLVHQAGGTGTYKWSDGTEITKVKSISGALDSLLKYVLSPDIHDVFFSHLNKNGVISDIQELGEQLKDAGKGEAAEVKVDLTNPVELLKGAIEFKHIILDTSDMKVRYLNDQGEIQKSFPLGLVSTVTDWEEELAENIKSNTQVMGRLRKLVANSIKSK